MAAIAPVTVLGCAEVYVSGDCRLPMSTSDDSKVPLTLVLPGPEAELDHTSRKAAYAKIDGEKADGGPVEVPPKTECATKKEGRRTFRLQVPTTARKVELVDGGQVAFTLNLQPPWQPDCNAADAEQRVACHEKSKKMGKPRPDILRAVVDDPAEKHTAAGARATSLLARYLYSAGESDRSLQLLGKARTAHRALGEALSDVEDAKMAAHLAIHHGRDFLRAKEQLALTDYAMLFPQLTAGARFYEATSTREQGHLLDAERMLCAVEGDASYAGDDKEALNAVVARSVALMRLGNTPGAKRQLEAGLARYTHAPAESQATANQNLAEAEKDLWFSTRKSGALDDAQRALSRARDIADKNELRPAIQCGILADLSDFELLGGNLDEAEKLAEKVATLTQAGSCEKEHELQGKIVRAEVDLSRGQPELARDSLAKIAKEVREQNVSELTLRVAALRARVEPDPVERETRAREALMAAREKALLSPLDSARGLIPGRLLFDLGNLADSLRSTAPDLALLVVRTMLTLDVAGVARAADLVRVSPDQKSALFALLDRVRKEREERAPKLKDRMEAANCGSCIKLVEELKEDEKKDLEALTEAYAQAGFSPLAPPSPNVLDPGRASLDLVMVRNGVLGALSRWNSSTFWFYIDDVPNLARNGALDGDAQEEDEQQVELSRRQLANDIIQRLESNLDDVDVLTVMPVGPLHDLPFGSAMLRPNEPLFLHTAVLFSMGLQPAAGPAEPIRSAIIAFDTLENTRMGIAPAHDTAEDMKDNLSQLGVKTRLRGGSEVSFRALKEDLAGFDLAAFIAHGSSNPDILLSGITLKQTRKDDSFVFGTGDILRLKKVPTYVFLGVCGGDASAASGYGISPGEAFLVQGSSAVVASPNTLHDTEIRWIAPRLFEKPIASPVALALRLQELEIDYHRANPEEPSDLYSLRVIVP